MSQLDFFNLNSHRSYPIVLNDDYTTDTSGWLAYCRFIVRPDIDYDPSVSSVFLRASIVNGTAISSTDNVVTIQPGIHFLFESDCPAMTSLSFLVSFEPGSQYVSAPIQVISRRHAYELIGIPNQLPAAVEDYAMEGTVVIGRPTTIPSGTTILSPIQRVEPALVMNVPEPAYGPGRGSVRIYNSPRTVYTPSEKCAQTGSVAPNTDYVLEVNTQSPVRFAGGHSTVVSQNVILGSITIDARSGAGELGHPCADVMLVGETERTDDRGQDGAPKCQEVLRSINGSQGPHIQISALDGVQIGSYPQLNRIIIGISGKDGVACPSFDSSEAVECMQDVDGIVCGDNNTPVPCTPEPDSGVGYADPAFIEGLATATGTRTKYTSPYASTGYAVTTCGSPCVWKENAGSWELMEYGCISPCDCSEPDRAPAYEFEQVTTSCFEMLVNTYGVRNADFTDNHPLAGWDISGNVVVVTEDTAINSVDLPMAYLESTLDTDATILQRYIPVTRGKSYKIVFDAWVKSGTCSIEMLEAGLTTLRYSFSENNEVSPLEIPTYIPRISNPTAVIRSKPGLTSAGALYFARLGFIKLGG